MTVDLKIAEALGIQVLSDFEESFGVDQYPYICIQIDTLPTYHTRYENGDMSAFWWSLTGPDDGNTAAVIIERLREKRYHVSIGCDEKECHITVQTTHGLFSSGAYIELSLALREAAAKALKVEV